MAISKKLEIIYHNGQPDGIRSIRRHLSTMTTYVIPRPLLSEAKKLSGINRPGIYYLISENDDNKIAQIYIGQTRNGVVRLDDHNRSKDFWNKAIMFLADSKTFSLDMIPYLCRCPRTSEATHDHPLPRSEEVRQQLLRLPLLR